MQGGYVGEHVAVSGAFGNVDYERGSKVAGIISDPDVYQIEVDESADFLILGSDGIWDALKDQFVMTHARKALRTSERMQLQQLLKTLPMSAEQTTLLPLLWCSSLRSRCLSVTTRCHVE